MRYPIILIDNGHGKETWKGGLLTEELLEWKWTREIALALRDELKERNCDVFLVTPRGDRRRLPQEPRGSMPTATSTERRT